MAKKSTIEKVLESQHGELNKVIPEMVNQFGQEGAAVVLCVKQSWISRWLRGHGYVEVRTWVRVREQPVEVEN